MLTEFQQVMESILIEFPYFHALFDDIFILSKGTEIKHITMVDKLLKNIDRENLALNLSNGDIVKSECKWLGHKIVKLRKTPLKRKTELNDKLQPPKYLSKLKSFIGSIHKLHKHLPALAE